jgi:hypothetical protein
MNYEFATKWKGAVLSVLRPVPAWDENSDLYLYLSLSLFLSFSAYFMTFVGFIGCVAPNGRMTVNKECRRKLWWPVLTNIPQVSYEKLQ